MFFRVKNVGSHSYVQLVENSWEDGRSKQRVLVTLGSLDALRQSGQIDALLASGRRLSETILVLRGCEPFLFAVSNGRFKCLRRLDFFAGALPGLAITAHRPRDLF
jgi:hypothetical protein